TSPTNVQSARFDLIAENKAEASRAFFSHLRKLKGWDLLRITDIPPEGAALEFRAIAQESGFPFGVYESHRSVFIRLPSSIEGLQSMIGSKLRGNLRRRRKLLETKGKLWVEQITGGAELQDRLEECFAMEQSGWK